MRGRAWRIPGSFQDTQAGRCNIELETLPQRRWKTRTGCSGTVSFDLHQYAHSHIHELTHKDDTKLKKLAEAVDVAELVEK